MLTACGGDADLMVRASRRLGLPLAGLEVTALPVNPDRLLDSLATAARTPQPRFPELEAAMAAYRDVRPTPTALPGAAWEATRDSIEVLADSIRQLNRASLAYREAYGRLRGMYDRLSRRAAERDRGVQGQMREARDLAQQAARAADSLRRWEQVAYADFSSRLSQAVRRTGRDIQQQTSDSTGVVRFVLAPGRWWLLARSRDPVNPFEEFYWNVPLTLTSVVPVALPLSERTGRRRWRH